MTRTHEKDPAVLDLDSWARKGSTRVGIWNRPFMTQGLHLQVHTQLV